MSCPLAEVEVESSDSHSRLRSCEDQSMKDTSVRVGEDLGEPEERRAGHDGRDAADLAELIDSEEVEVDDERRDGKEVWGELKGDDGPTRRVRVLASHALLPSLASARLTLGETHEGSVLVPGSC